MTLKSVLPAWQESLIFILLSGVEKYQVFSPASQNWTVFKQEREPVFFFFFQLRRVVCPWWTRTLTEIFMNNYSSKTLLATFQSTRSRSFDRCVWTLSSWCFSEKETPAASAVTSYSLTLLSLFFLQLEAEPAGSSFCVSSRLCSAPCSAAQQL